MNINFKKEEIEMLDAIVDTALSEANDNFTKEDTKCLKQIKKKISVKK